MVLIGSMLCAALGLKITKPLVYLPCSNNVDPVLSLQDMNLFDRSTQFFAKENGTSNMKDIESLIPTNLLATEKDRRQLVDDLHTNLRMIQPLAADDDKITCRLTLLEGVRCPKWHQDNVKIRLLKTYVGKGTEFVAPDDFIVRFLNFFRSLFDQDLDVDPFKVQRARAGDVLIIRGKAENQEAAVLHRSPPAAEGEKRLLYSVTIS